MDTKNSKILEVLRQFRNLSDDDQQIVLARAAELAATPQMPDQGQQGVQRLVVHPAHQRKEFIFSLS